MPAYGTPRPGSSCSLADVEPGDPLEVVHILFGSLRYRYEASGVTVGVRARCRERTPDRILLELAGGGTVQIEAVHAAFVEVAVLGVDGDRTHASRGRSPGEPSPLAVLAVSGRPEPHPSLA